MTKLQWEALAYTPYLCAVKEGDEQHADWLLPDNTNALEALFERISAVSSIAGPAYWHARICELVMWQPHYLGVIAYYKRTELPNFDTLKQRITNTFISGYDVEELSIPQNQRLSYIATGLTSMRHFYADEITRRFALSTRFCLSLWQDNFFSLLDRVCRENQLNVDDEFHLWGNAFDIPPRRIQRLLENSPFQRSTCCHAYQCEQGKYCDNCPKRVELLKRA